MHLPPLDRLSARLEERLAEPLPGLQTQLSMSPPMRGTDEKALRELAQTGRRAAVLLLMYPLADGSPAFVLTLRQKALQSHSGQVSLPGGATDEGESPVECALREAEEEVAVPRDLPGVIGELTNLYIPPSHFTVTPVVACSGRRPAFRRRQQEVAAIIEVPLMQLLDPERCKTAEWRLHGQDINVPYYALQGYEVWGATAMMLAEFAAIVREVAPG